MKIKPALLLIAGLGIVAGSLAAEEPEADPAVREGARLFEYYCRACHGDSARGDGPTAEVLTIKPADLTRLSRNNDGKFPLERVERAIDGRNRTAAHGSQMPIWGLGFQVPGSDANQEREVSHRIEQLVAYLRALQR